MAGIGATPFSPTPGSFCRPSPASMCARSDSSSSSSSDSDHHRRRRHGSIPSKKGIKKFMSKFESDKKVYKIKNLKDVYDGKLTPKVDFTNDGKMIISGLEYHVPDLAAQYKEDYDDKIELIKNSNCKIKEDILKSTKYNNTFISVGVVILLILILIFLMIVYFTRDSS